MTSRSRWQQLGWATALGTGMMVGGMAIATPLMAQPTGEPILEEQGSLDDGDTVLQSDGSLYDEYTFVGQAGQQVVVTLESNAFDTYLIVLDPTGNALDQNDDISEENFNSELALTLPSDGTYTVIANSYDSTGRGAYTLTINDATGVIPATPQDTGSPEQNPGSPAPRP